MQAINHSGAYYLPFYKVHILNARNKKCRWKAPQWIWQDSNLKSSAYETDISPLYQQLSLQFEASAIFNLSTCTKHSGNSDNEMILTEILPPWPSTLC
jgi:hypothetical protein